MTRTRTRPPILTKGTLLRCLCLLTGLLGCATPPPSRHLLDARAAYAKVQNGNAARLAPADLHTAKVALQEAEESYLDDPESARTTTLAYVALRQAQRVESLANTKAAAEELSRVEGELHDLQERELSRARALLSVQEQRLANTNAQLREEREAREAAEARERIAMQQLAAATALNVKEEARGTVIVLPDNVLFDSGRYKLTSSAQNKLAMVAATLAPQSESHDIVVEGHTDSRGTHSYNMELSQSRAQAVRDFLVQHGVQGEAISAIGMGPDRPLASNNHRSGRAQNRRVEIIIKPLR